MIWSIQVLRFVAALMIVYLHAAFIAFSATGSSGVIPAGVDRHRQRRGRHFFCDFRANHCESRAGQSAL